MLLHQNHDSDFVTNKVKFINRKTNIQSKYNMVYLSQNNAEIEN